MLAVEANIVLSMPETLKIPSSIETLGEAIHFAREKRGMTLRALANQVQVSAPFLSDVEHNRRSTEKLGEIAKALRVDVEDFKRLDGRLPADLKDWLSRTPEMVALLKDIKASGKGSTELRQALLRTRLRR